jgi:dTDP-6-deoxy-L-talose 4-dehydrogenase (NAD+)
MKVLVTGANGYIGSRTVKGFLEKGIDVIAVDFNKDNIDPRAKFVFYDIFNSSKSIYSDLDYPDIVIHMAWKDGFKHNSHAHMEMLSSHYKFIKELIEGGLKRLVIMGSMHEIGYYEGAINENTPCNPSSMYGISKDSLRRSVLLLAKQKEIKLQWLRAYYIYGDDIKSNSIFSKILAACQEGKTRFPFTTGKNKYDFIKINDLVSQIVAVAMQDKVTGIIECCSGIPVSLSTQVENFIVENNLGIKLEYGAFPDRSYDSPALWGDNKKILKIMRGYVKK